MKIYFDTEFAEDGVEIKPISIGLKKGDQDGDEYHAIFTDTWSHASCNAWVLENVVKHLPTDRSLWKPKKQIAEEIHKFCGASPEFWAYFADYDWVVMAQLFGTMMDMPPHWPMYCNDLKQEMHRLGIKRDQLPEQTGREHDALEDARWVRGAHLWVLEHEADLVEQTVSAAVARALQPDLRAR